MEVVIANLPCIQDGDLELVDISDDNDNDDEFEALRLERLRSQRSVTPERDVDEEGKIAVPLTHGSNNEITFGITGVASYGKHTRATEHVKKLGNKNVSHVR